LEIEPSAKSPAPPLQQTDDHRQPNAQRGNEKNNHSPDDEQSPFTLAGRSYGLPLSFQTLPILMQKSLHPPLGSQQVLRYLAAYDLLALLTPLSGRAQPVSQHPAHGIRRQVTPALDTEFLPRRIKNPAVGTKIGA